MFAEKNLSDIDSTEISRIKHTMNPFYRNNEESQRTVYDIDDQIRNQIQTIEHITPADTDPKNTEAKKKIFGILCEFEENIQKLSTKYIDKYNIFSTSRAQNRTQTSQNNTLLNTFKGKTIRDRLAYGLKYFKMAFMQSMKSYGAIISEESDIGTASIDLQFFFLKLQYSISDEAQYSFSSYNTPETSDFKNNLRNLNITDYAKIIFNEAFDVYEIETKDKYRHETMDVIYEMNETSVNFYDVVSDSDILVFSRWLLRLEKYTERFGDYDFIFCFDQAIR
jgi:hypothetical protein